MESKSSSKTAVSRKDLDIIDECTTFLLLQWKQWANLFYNCVSNLAKDRDIYTFFFVFISRQLQN